MIKQSIQLSVNFLKKFRNFDIDINLKAIILRFFNLLYKTILRTLMQFLIICKIFLPRERTTWTDINFGLLLPYF